MSTASTTPALRVRNKEKSPDEGLSGVSPRFVINGLSQAIIHSARNSISTMDALLALKDAIESDARIESSRKRRWIDYLVLTRKEFYNRWVKEDVHKALFISFEQEVADLLDKYLDEVEAMLDNRQVRDPITNEERRPDERFLRAVEEKIHLGLGQAIVPARGGAQGHERLQARRAIRPRQPRPAARRLAALPVRAAPRCAAAGQFLQAPDDEVRAKISAVEQRLVDDYGYDSHCAREALNYVTTLLAQE
jgi:serine protein kinase